MTVQPEFQPLLDEALRLSQEALGSRLCAFYLHGSIAQGDAIAGVSDLDAMLILADDVTVSDRTWQTAAQQELHTRFPIAEEVHLTLLSLDDLAGNDFARFALRYNASLASGQDVVRSMDCPAPDAAMAKSRLDFARQCFDDALTGKQPACTGPLPADPYWLARKFARYFVVIEGAYYLMAQGAFISFAPRDVLPALERYVPQFAPELHLTQQVLADAPAAGITGQAYLYKIHMLVKWMFNHIQPR